MVADRGGPWGPAPVPLRTALRRTAPHRTVHRTAPRRTAPAAPLQLVTATTVAVVTTSIAACMSRIARRTLSAAH